MGVTGMWELLAPAQSVTRMEILGERGFKENKDSLRAFRLGIDAPQWLFHVRGANAESKDGEDLGFRGLFYRIIKLMRAGVVAVFVFDGANKPEWKRGKGVGRHWADPSEERNFMDIIRALGMLVRRASGEAEAELAYLAKTGQIDAVLTDDVDALVFGAPLVLRNHKSTPQQLDRLEKADGIEYSDEQLAEGLAPPTSLTEEKESIPLFRLESATRKLQLTQNGLMLFTYFKGGDYFPEGIKGFGPKTAQAVARSGFGDEFVRLLPEQGAQLDSHAVERWREGVCQELRTNASGYANRRSVALAGKFADMKTDSLQAALNFYKFPAVHTTPVDWHALPPVDVEECVRLMGRIMLWTHESGHKGVVTVLAPAIIMRELREAALVADRTIPRFRGAMGDSATLHEAVLQVSDEKSANSTGFINAYRVKLDNRHFERLFGHTYRDLPPAQALPEDSPRKRLPVNETAREWFGQVFVDACDETRAAVERYRGRRASPSKRGKRTTASEPGGQRTLSFPTVKTRAPEPSKAASKVARTRSVPSPTKSRKQTPVASSRVIDLFNASSPFTPPKADARTQRSSSPLDLTGSDTDDDELPTTDDLIARMQARAKKPAALPVARQAPPRPAPKQVIDIDSD